MRSQATCSPARPKLAMRVCLEIETVRQKHEIHQLTHKTRATRRCFEAGAVSPGPSCSRPWRPSHIKNKSRAHIRQVGNRGWGTTATRACTVCMAPQQAWLRVHTQVGLLVPSSHTPTRSAQHNPNEPHTLTQRPTRRPARRRWAKKGALFDRTALRFIVVGSRGGELGWMAGLGLMPKPSASNARQPPGHPNT